MNDPRKNCAKMGSYRLSEEAKDDLIGIHQYGVREFGKIQADAYFWQLIERLDVLAQTPLLYQAQQARSCISGHLREQMVNISCD